MLKPLNIFVLGALLLSLGVPLQAQLAPPVSPITVLALGENERAPLPSAASISVLSMPGLPEVDTARGAVLATLLRSNPVFTFITVPENLDGLTGQFFMVADVTLTQGAADSGNSVTIGADSMPLDLFGARLDALVDAFAPEHRQIAFFRVRDPDSLFAASVAEFQAALSIASFAMAVVTVGDAPDTCAPAVEPHLALLTGVADRVPFGDGDAISTAAEAESWLSAALARPGQRNPVCADTYSLIIRSSDDATRPVVFHKAGVVLPELETRLYRETFEAMFLMESDDVAKIGSYLESCVYCPNERLLTEKLGAMREAQMTLELESSIWEEIREDDRADRLEVYLANCSLCTFQSEAEALISDLRAKAKAREAETDAFLHASASRNLAALRDYVSSCMACDYRSEAAALMTDVEADAAYQAERQALAFAMESKDRPALEAWLAACVTCDGRAEAEAAVAEIVQAEELIAPCERAAGMPAKGGPRQLSDIDIDAARAACAAAIVALPQNPLLKVLNGRIEQAGGNQAEAMAAYEAGVAANVPEAFGLASYLRFAPLDGSAPDYETAARLARNGAALGDWLSKEILMLAYSRELVAGNGPADAVALARENAAEGNAAGQFFLGYFLLSGIGNQIDEAEAALWLKKASDAGYLRANPFLSEILERGTVVEAAPDEAARLLWDAFNGGDSIALARLTEQLSERSPGVIRIVQQNLREAGYYGGQVDGLPGPSTLRAVLDYAKTVQETD